MGPVSATCQRSPKIDVIHDWKSVSAQSGKEGGLSGNLSVNSKTVTHLCR